MRHAAKPTCPVCESRGVEAYAALRDHLFGAPGSWRMVRCVNALCGIYWLDPAPLKEDLPVAYRGYYTHGHADAAERPNAFRAGVRNAYVARKLGYPAPNESISTKLCSYVAPFVARRGQAWLYAGFYLPWVDGGRLLEVGCGSGWQLDRMKELGWRVKGVDFDPQAAAAARARGLDVVIGDVRELNLEAGSFDAVVMAHVLEHVFDPVSLLAECRRLLKPGGRLISITPNGRSFGHRYYKAAWRGLEPPRHIAVFTVAGLHLACRRAGLDVERIDVTARDAANLLLASGRIRRIRGDAQVVRPSAAHAPPLTTRLLAVMERIGIALGFAIGEETVLTAVKPHRDER